MLQFNCNSSHIQNYISLTQLEFNSLLSTLFLLQGGEDWKRKLVQPPGHFDGSFVDADLQKFRPEPNPNPAEDPWYASRMPDQTMQAFDRLQAPQATYGFPEMPLSGPYGSMYPQDELSRIKMRNRRFMSSCAQEMMPQGKSSKILG